MPADQTTPGYQDLPRLAQGTENVLASRERHILGLDVIRFAAAAFVMALHYLQRTGATNPIAYSGFIGVETFFVVSGYVITFSAEGQSAGSFAIARIVRLVPGLWICATATALVLLVAGSDPNLPLHYFNTLIVRPNHQWIDGVYWTLEIESVFYCMIWMALFVKAPNAIVIWSLGGLSALYWLYRVSAPFLHLPPLAFMDRLPWPILTGSWVQFGCFFSLGAVFREWQVFGPSWWRGGFIALLVMVGTVSVGFVASHESHIAPIAWFPFARRAIPIALWLALTFGVAASVRFNHRLHAVFGPVAPAIRMMGLATYPLYLIHNSAAGATIPFLGPYAAAMLAIAASAVIARWIEPPAQRLAKRTLISLAALPFGITKPSRAA